MAAIVYAGTSSATANSTFYRSSSVPAQVGDLLVAFVAASGTVQRPGTFETSNQPGLASSFTLVTSALWGGSAHSLYCFVQNDFCASTSGSTIARFGCVGDGATGAIINIVRLTGMFRSGLTAVRQSEVSSNNAASSRPLVTLASALLSSNPALGYVGTNSSQTQLTPPGGWTEFADTGYATPITGAEFCGNVGSDSTAIRWGTSTSSLNGALVVEFDASEAAAQIVLMGAMLMYQQLY